MTNIDVTGCRYNTFDGGGSQRTICSLDGYFCDCIESKDCYYKQLQELKAKFEKINKKNEIWYYVDGSKIKKWTGLIDTLGNKIFFGDVVHWTDGGDELSLEERIASRWDRIAVVSYKGIEVVFRTFDSPSESSKKHRQEFSYGNFIYKDTQKYLTVAAEGRKEYAKKFKNAGECMAYVLKLRGKYALQKL